MPNYCDFDMKIVGERKNIEELIAVLDSDYSYEPVSPHHINGKIYPLVHQPASPIYYTTNGYKLETITGPRHMFRVFEAYVNRSKDELNASYISGYCAWSVYSCMFGTRHTYYDDFITEKYGNKYIGFMGTTLPDESRRLNLKIEVYSEEPGCGFMEHYLIDNGEILIEDCVDYQEVLDEEGIETGEYKIIGGFENTNYHI